MTTTAAPLRVCLVYDCLFPWTIGGAERWYRAVAEALAQAGHDVTYLTRMQWTDGPVPEIPGVRVVSVARDEPLYGPDGNRRIGQAVRFGIGVGRHLVRNRGAYDVVHTASFPYFSLLAAAAARRRDPFTLIVDWHEVWSAGYWHEYLGPALGRVGHGVQRSCLRVPQEATCFSRLHERRLRSERVNGAITLLEGEYSGALEPAPVRDAEPLVVFAGRHIAEKRVPALVPALVRARAQIPDLRAVIFGDGPQRSAVVDAIAHAGAEEWIDVPGFAPADDVSDAMHRAMCMVLPSRREGYGMVVIEASAASTPSVVVADDDNAATEHVLDGVNGFVAPSAAPTDLAEAIVAVDRGGRDLRASTATWFAEHAARLSLDASLEQLLRHYAEAASTRR